MITPPPRKRSQLVQLLTLILFLLTIHAKGAVDIGDIFGLLQDGYDTYQAFQNYENQMAQFSGGGSGGSDFELWEVDGFYVTTNLAGNTVTITVLGFDNSSVTSNNYEGFIPDLVSGIMSSNVPITAIYDGAFAAYPPAGVAAANIATLDINSLIKYIGPHALDIPTLSYINVESNIYSTNFTSVNGVLFTADKKVLVRFPEAMAASTYAVPNTVTNIADGAFLNCSGVHTLVIGPNVTTIGNYAFASNSLQSVYFNGNAPTNNGTAFAGDGAAVYYLTGTSGWGTNYAGGTTSAYNPFTYTTQNGAVTITGISSVAINNPVLQQAMVVPASINSLPVTDIASETFYENQYLTTLTIADSVTNIEPQAALDSFALTSVTLGTNVMSIGSAAFEQCTVLTNINFPGRLATIGALAFDNSAITAVSLPASVTNVTPGAFAYCHDLTFINVDGANPIYSNLYSGALVDKVHGVIVQYPGAGQSDTAVSTSSGTTAYSWFGAGYTSIADYAFAGCQNILNVHIASQLTSIGLYAFDGCNSLTNIEMMSVNSLHGHAFANCSSLKSVRMGGPAPSVAGGTFSGSGNANPYYIPGETGWGSSLDGTATVQWNLYSYTNSSIVGNYMLTAYAGDIFWPDDYNNIWYDAYHITLPTSIDGHTVDEFDRNVFAGLQIESIVIPNTYSWVDDYSFYNCVDLTNVVLGSGIHTLGNHAFDGCTALGSLVIPSTVLTLGTDAIEGGTVYFNGQPPTVTGSPFVNTPTHIYLLNGALSWGSTYYGAPVTVYPFSYTQNGNSVTVTGYTGTDMFLAVPSYINNLPVTSIGSGAFQNQSSFSTVYLPPTVTSIGDNAFSGCSGLQYVFDQASNLVSIGSQSFAGCSAMQQMVLGTNLTTIGSGAFSGCSGLGSIDLPATATNLGSSAFSDCSGLHTFTLPAGVTSISPNLFSGCSGISQISLPGSVTSIGSSAFSRCTGLQQVTLSSNLTSLGADAFSNCTALAQIALPASLNSIGGDAFLACGSLTNISVNAGNSTYSSVGGVLFNQNQTILLTCPQGITGTYTLPSTATTIANNAFKLDTGLSTIVFSASLTSWSTNSFQGCSQLTAFSVDSANALYSSADGVVFSKDGTVLILFPPAVSGTYTIPNNVVSIGANAFAQCNLSEVDIGTNVTSIGSAAFYGCNHLSKVDVGENVASIGSNAFADCNSLHTVDFEGNAPANDGTAFAGDTGVTLTYLTGTTGWGANYGGVAASVIPLTYVINTDGSITIVKYVGSGGTVTVPSSMRQRPVTIIGAGAFADNANVTGVNLPSTLLDIGPYAFTATGIHGISIPGQVTNIETAAFATNDFRSALVIPDSVITIGTNAFQNCGLLPSLSCGRGLVTIEDGAFQNCHFLTSVAFDPNLVSIGDHAFEHCEDISQLDANFSLTYLAPINLRNIGKCAFAQCWISTCYLADTVTNIGDYAFASNRIGQADFPTSLVSLGNYAFAWNPNCYGYATGDAPMPQTNATAFFGDSGPMYYQAGNSGWGSTFGGVTAYAQPEYFDYSDNGDGTITITGYHGGKDAVIPSAYLGKTVTAIAYNTFAGNTTLVSVSLPSTVTSIGANAFGGCTSLTNIILPSSITGIGSSAFSGCTKLTAITLPSALTQLGSDAFQNCTSLTNIIIPNTLTDLGSDAFQNCSSLASVYFLGNAPTNDGTALAGDSGIIVYYLPGATGWDSWSGGGTATMWIQYDYVTNGDNTLTITGYFGPGGDITVPSAINGFTVSTIGDSAFTSNALITEVSLPDSVTTIGTNAFASCIKLATLNLGPNLTNLGDYAFAYSGLKSITLPGSLTTLGEYVFEDCQSLTMVNLSTNLTSIGKSCFGACSSWLTVNLPDSLTYIGYGAFWGCNMNSIYIPGGAVDQFAFFNCPNLSSLTFGTNVTSIGFASLANCTALQTVTIPASVTNLDNSAFANCSELTSVYFDGNPPGPSGAVALNPASPNTFAYYPAGNSNWGPTFSGVYTVENSFGTAVTNGGVNIVFYTGASTVLGIPDYYNGMPVTALGIFSIPSYCTSVVIPATATLVGPGSFGQASALTNITVRAGNPDFISSGGALLDKAGTTLISCPPGWTGTFVIPDGVTNIGTQAFYNCHNLTNVIIPSSVTTISAYAFESSGLYSITIPGSVTSIGSYAFSFCSNLKTAIFEGNLPATDSSIFQLDSGLTIYDASGLTGWTTTFSGYPIIAYATNYANGLSLGQVIITGSSGIGFGAFTVPDSINGLPVGGVSSNGFSGFMSSAYIGPNIGYIGTTPFLNCGLLTNIMVDPANLAYSSTNGVLFNKNQTELYEYPLGLSGGYAVPEGVRTIGPEAFYHCVHLTGIGLPSTLTTISNSAFYYCIGLTNVTVPDSVITIGPSAFANCSGLTSVTIGHGLQYLDGLGSDAFASCVELTSATFTGDWPGDDGTAFSGDPSAVVFYYPYPTSLGWGNPTFGGARTQAILPSGAVAVTISPSSITNLVTWSLDGKPAPYGQIVLTNISAGQHTISFQSLDWYTTPQDQIITVTAGATNQLAGNYAGIPYGTVEVTITPFGITNSVYWSFDGAAEPYGQITLTNVSVGQHTIRFQPLDWYTAPSDQVITVGNGYTNEVAGNYARIPFNVSTNADGSLTINGFTGSGAAIIPTNIVGHTVTAIAPSAFADNESLTTVAIPDTVTNIGDSAFENCFYLSRVSIGNGVIDIGTNAFSSCTQLREVDMGTNVAEIGDNAFYYCQELSRLSLPLNLQSIGSLAFNYSGLQSITIPDNTTNLGYGVFFNCDNMRSMAIGRGITSDASTLAGCKNLTAVYFDGNAWTLSPYDVPFNYYAQSVTVYYEPGTTGWDSGTFGGKPTQSWLSLLTWGTNADNTISLSNYTGGTIDFITPQSIGGMPVTTIGDQAFAGMQLSSLSVSPGVESAGVAALAINQSDFVFLPETLTSISTNAMGYCRLTSITLPYSLTNFGEGALAYDNYLTNVVVELANPVYLVTNNILFTKNMDTLVQFPANVSGSYAVPGSVTTIAGQAFNSSQLSSLTLSTNTANIGEYALSGTSLKSLNLPASVTNFGYEAANYNGSLTKITVDPANPAYTSVKGVLFDKSLTTLIQYPGAVGGGYTIPSTVTTIADGAFGESEVGPITIPEQVSQLGAWAFQGCRNLIKVTLPAGITNVADGLFAECNNLTDVTLSTNTIRIGDSSFEYCQNLTHLALPASLRSLTEYAFDESGLTNMIIPEGVTEIPDYAFADCTRLTSVTLPNSVTVIGANAFADCYYLTSIKLSTNLTQIADQAFYRCTRLNSITIPASVTDLGYEAFASCSALWSVMFEGDAPTNDGTAFDNSNGATVYYSPGTTGWDSGTYAGVTASPIDSFFNYTVNGDNTVTITGLNGAGGEVEIPATIAGYPVTGIASQAFAGSDINSVFLPATVTNLQSEALAYSGAADIEVDPANPAYTSDGGVLFNKDETELIQFISGPASYTIPATVTNIAPGAFAYEQSSGGGLKGGGGVVAALTNLMVKAGNPAYTSIGGVLFDKAQTSLIQFPPGLAGGYTIPASVTNIAAHAFDASAINGVTLPATVLSLGADSFANSTISDLYFEGAIPAIDSTAFENDRQTSVFYLTGMPGWDTASLSVAAVIPWQMMFNFVTNADDSLTVTAFNGSLDYVMFPPAFDGHPVTDLGTAFAGAGISGIAIPDTVKNIDDDAFNSSRLQSVVVPAGITNIGDRAFANCQNLSGITLPGSVTTIGDSAFMSSSLPAVTIPSSVTTIKDNAFVETPLIEITVPNTVINIGTNVFNGCWNLTTVVLPNSMTSIGDGMFADCNKLSDINLPSSLTSIGNGAFESCYQLFAADIPNSVTSIGDSAFQNSSIYTLSLGNNVTNIGEYAFQYCYISQVVFPASLITLGTNAFADNGMQSVYFEGNAPAYDDGTDFADDQPTVYYLAGTTGWGSTFGGAPTAVWQSQTEYTVNPDNTITITSFSGGGDVTIPQTIDGLPVSGIAPGAFDGVDTITHITIGANIVNVGSNAFNNCSSLVSVTMSADVTNIDRDAFGDCASLTNITVDPANPFYSSTNGVLFNKAQTMLVQMPGGVGGSYSIPTTVTSIGNDAFEGCAGLTNIVIPPTVVCIGDPAFAYSGLTTITIPASVTNIGDYAFAYCDSLKSAYFDGNAPPDDGTVFYGDSQATAYYQPSSTGWSSTFGGIPAVGLVPAVVTPMTVTRTAHLQLIIAWANVATNWSDPNGGAVGLASLNLTTTNGVSLLTKPGFILYPGTTNLNDEISYTVTNSLGLTTTGTIDIVVNTNVFGQMSPSITTSGGNPTVHFAGIPHYSYSVQVSTDLLNWTTLWTTNAPANGLFQFTDPNPPLPAAFYRLSWNP